MRPYVSIICITYNQKNYIESAINGFLSQIVNFDIEILIADDASTDGTQIIIKKYLDLFPNKIKFFESEKNSGGKKNWNNLINKSLGKYIAICDGDDYWIDNYKLQKQTNILDNNSEYDLVFTDFDMIIKDKIVKSVFKNKILPIPVLFDEILVSKPYLAPQSWLFRGKYREIILEYNNPINNFVDGTFPLLLEVSHSSKIFFMNESTIAYRKHKKSVTGTNDLNKIKLFITGVYEIQKYYSRKYNVHELLLNSIHKNYYKNITPYAIALNDKKLIQSIKKYNKNKKIFLSVILFLSKLYIFRLFIYLLIKLRKFF